HVLDHLPESQLSEQEDEPDPLCDSDSTEQEAKIEMDLTYLGILDTTDDLAFEVLYWVYGTRSTRKDLNHQSIRDWAQEVMFLGSEQRPGYHALAAAGMLFVEASRPSESNNYAHQGPSKILLASALGTGCGSDLPPTNASTLLVYASVVQALCALQRRNRDTMTAKTADVQRWEKFRKEVTIIERCLTTLQNAACRVFKQVKTSEDLCEGYNTDLVGHFLKAWGASGVDDLLRSLQTLSPGYWIDFNGPVGLYNNAEVPPSLGSIALHTNDKRNSFFLPDSASFGPERHPPTGEAGLPWDYAGQWSNPAFHDFHEDTCELGYVVPDYSSLGTENHRRQPVVGATDIHADQRTQRDFPSKSTETLLQWWKGHLANPYPTHEQKLELAERAQLELHQVCSPLLEYGI
ncbi:hypothetical protein LTS03_011881, partial [Exophiala xenobiotica]